MLLRIADATALCRVLGPGMRFVVWVQGCTLRCPGCVSPDTHRLEGGQLVQVERLASRILGSRIDGITISGGEPMLQAAALCELVLILRKKSPDLTFLCYTGYTLECLRATGNRDQRSLLGLLDCLIDGPFLETEQQNPPLRWRGSQNQKVHLLTPRVQDWGRHVSQRGVWLEYEVGQKGLAWRGIPPPGFDRRFREVMALAGLDVTGGVRSSQVSEEEPRHESISEAYSGESQCETST
jgi:anaerobic ribonucleoside-triphosphate reductase activating protein